ncbi:MAG: copper oxidase [Acidimicrobiia bacterium]|nr:copper oxidase [Acidimicrobiia bacterium]
MKPKLVILYMVLAFAILALAIAQPTPARARENPTPTPTDPSEMGAGHAGDHASASPTPTPEDTMHDMSTMEEMSGESSGGGHAMGPASAEGVLPATETRGAQPLDFRLEGDVKVFELTARPVLWEILDGVTVVAWTYNGTVPGPMIRVTEGDRVRVILKNELPEPTTIHWHGVEVPNAMDGVPGVTQDPVLPGATFTYEFVAKPAGTFMYHSHFESDTQVMLGLYAPFLIDPATPEANPPDVDMVLMLSEWLVTDGQTYAAMPMAGMEPNYFTINGKAFPAVETINVRVGERVRLRLMSIGQFVHPMHLHGVPFKIVATDGHPVPAAAQLTKDTVSVAPGERYDIEWLATEPGQWMLHCHILHHTTNDGVEPGGLMLIVNVTE